MMMSSRRNDERKSIVRFCDVDMYLYLSTILFLDTFAISSLPYLKAPVKRCPAYVCSNMIQLKPLALSH